ncbi:hypothetical protein SJI00_10985 [Pseudomonas sp. RP23018S]|uniref:hypothetical protein n=1 Tax=Pseudomonas sp. RP23018S TaxID=3096037 RepID=UPI002ACA5FC5|nr:hypothetical protein [Pseudomonas sp. RP23018S]MDZ5603294.1 hypothetical protein [Pseudomonas sp. RP23018S]
MSGTLSVSISNLQKHLELALFLLLAAGYVVHQTRFKPIPLTHCGAFPAAVVVGQFHLLLADSMKNTFFMLFIFALDASGRPPLYARFTERGIRAAPNTDTECGGQLRCISAITFANTPVLSSWRAPFSAAITGMLPAD